MSVVCRICMELVGSSSMSLFNKKNSKKTEICLTYEILTNLEVNQSDELPKECCLPCVAELNKCLTFREKCLRTYKTLSAFYKNDGSDDEDKEIEILIPEDKSEGQNQIIVSQDSIESLNNSNLENSHLIELQTIVEEDDKRNEISEDGVVLVYCINEGNPEDEVQEPLSTSTHNSAFKCTICSMEFVRKKNFENHYKKYHEKEGNKSPSTTEPTQIRVNLTKEKNREDLKEKLKDDPNAKHCKYCNALFLNEKSLKIHERRKNCQLKCFECDHCKKVFMDKSLFEQHVKTHAQPSEPELKVDDADRKYKCTYENCTKSFKMISTFKDHLRTHDRTKPYICSICNRGFSQNTNLKQHLRRHNLIKPFKCEWDLNVCTKSFVSKGELDSHLRKHSGAHPFACEMCDSKFTTSSSLVKHRRIHSGEKPYSCEFCPMRFTALGTLKNHQKTHTGDKPHACRYCEKSFAQKSDMTSHERTHTQNRPYACKICNMSFHQSGTLKTHMKIHSKMTNDGNEGDQ